jgi:hypothetical protein
VFSESMPAFAASSLDVVVVGRLDPHAAQAHAAHVNATASQADALMVGLVEEVARGGRTRGNPACSPYWCK